ncbi:MAG TPA: methyltransferase domain-containing protein [Acetobacteraceae bacterium]|jgi:SAM-dependent methyltransferase
MPLRLLAAKFLGSLHRLLIGSAAGKASSGTDIMGLPVVDWPSAADPVMVEMACPNCAAPGPKPLHLTINFATLPGSRRNTSVLRCPACTCLFYSSQIPPDYAEDAMLERGRVPFYLQQGAGLSLITRPLARVRTPACSTYAEIGCGFGFGLDYAAHAKRWSGRGIDPGGIGGLGEQMLGVAIDRRYLGDAEPELEATCDVVMASETVEHVLSPAGFVRVLRSMLRPGGILILTTPDGAELRPETAPSVLIGLLSPGLHLIFQNRQSLLAMLEAADFRHIQVEKDGHSLVAFAGDRPLDLENDPAILRAEYRTYLERRAHDFPPRHELFLGFAGRALQEAVNDGVFDQARRALADMQRAAQTRFGRSLDRLGDWARATTGVALEDLARRMPLNLGGVLYADAILRLASGEPRATLGVRFLRAAAAAELLCRALGDLALADGMSEQIAWTARAEAVLCAAAGGAGDIVSQLVKLPPAPDAENGATRRQVIAERAFVELVNAGRRRLAADVATAQSFDAADWANAEVTAARTDSQRDVLFCLAVLDSSHDEPALIERSRDRFRRVQSILGAPGAPDGLFAAAQRGESAASQRLAGLAASHVADAADLSQSAA